MNAWCPHSHNFPMENPVVNHWTSGLQHSLNASRTNTHTDGARVFEFIMLVVHVHGENEAVGICRLMVSSF